MRFVAGRGAVAESHREAFAGRGAVAELLAGSDMAKRMAAPWLRAIGKLLPARGAAAELHREEATAGKEGRATAGKEGRATAGKEGRATAGKESHCRKGEPLPARRDCSGATGWSLFLMRPLCKLFLYL